MRGDIKNHIDVVQTIAPGEYTATQTGAAVDLANYDAAAVVLSVGAVSDGSFSVEVQHSDETGTGWAAVPDNELDGTEPGTLTATKVTVIGYHGIKRYLRVVATDGGTGDAAFGASVIRSRGRVKP